MLNLLKRPGAIFFFIAALLSLFAGRYEAPTWTTETILLDVSENEEGQLQYELQNEDLIIDKDTLVPIEQSTLSAKSIEEINRKGTPPRTTLEFVVTDQEAYYRIEAKKHFRYWSLLPALVALVLCWITKEPVTSLFGGIIIGAFLLQRYDITEAVLVPELSTKSAAGIIVLYLWLLG